jgi:hypothetical protein
MNMTMVAVRFYRYVRWTIERHPPRGGPTSRRTSSSLKDLHD